MRINLTCFADLAERYDCDYLKVTVLDMGDDATVGHVMRDTGIPAAAVAFVLVNGQVCKEKEPLHDGDRITLIPVSGGM